VEILASQFGGELVDWPKFLERLTGPESPQAVWIAGGYPHPWATEELATQFATLSLLIVQEVLPSPIGAVAHFRLPAPTFAERAGSYVNALHRLQSFNWAIRPPWGVQQDGQLYWRLLDRAGMYAARTVREEVAARFVHFSAATGPIPDVGVDLRVNQLAAEPLPVAELNRA
jgi:NADH-quinone oxidoreductase subunit G